MDILIKKIDSLIETINNNINTPKELQCFNVKQVASILGASENSVYNMIQTGVLKAFKIGVNESKKPQYRISRETLENYMNNVEVQNG